MSVRWAAAADAWEVGALVMEALEDAPSSEVELDELSDDPHRLGRSLLDGPGVVGVIADEGGYAAGFARLVPHEFLASRHVGEVQLVVRPGVRARGVGTQLLSGVEGLVRAQGLFAKLAMRVAADDRPLLALVQRAGWRLERVERGALRRDRALDVRLFARYLDPRIG